VEQHLAVTICPEVLGGLPVPREPSEIKSGSVLSKSGLDVTEQFRSGAEKALAICLAHQCRLAVLKSKSPSCGKGLVHNGLFDGGLVPGNGLAAQLLMDNGIEVLTEQEWLERQAALSPSVS
jgi:D-alanine-D-alanine ligase